MLPCIFSPAVPAGRPITRASESLALAVIQVTEQRFLITACSLSRRDTRRLTGYFSRQFASARLFKLYHQFTADSE